MVLVEREEEKEERQENEGRERKRKYGKGLPAQLLQKENGGIQRKKKREFMRLSWFRLFVVLG